MKHVGLRPPLSFGHNLGESLGNRLARQDKPTLIDPASTDDECGPPPAEEVLM